MTGTSVMCNVSLMVTTFGKQYAAAVTYVVAKLF